MILRIGLEELLVIYFTLFICLYYLTRTLVKKTIVNKGFVIQHIVTMILISNIHL